MECNKYNSIFFKYFKRLNDENKVQYVKHLKDNITVLSYALIKTKF